MKQTTVYLIDDDPALLEMLGDVVELSGLKAHGYTRASQFFAEVTRFEADSIMVLDLLMPEIDGIEVMRRLASMSNPPALILISGHDPAVLHAAEKLGRAHRLQLLSSLEKPLAIEQLQRLLEQHAPQSDSIRQHNPKALEREPSRHELQRATHSGQLLLHYQPQVALDSGAIAGVEALVRWQHPELGLIYPDRFIPLAERHGLIGNITHWVIGEVVRQKQQWQAAGTTLPVSVNISADDITTLTLPEQLAELLEGNRLDPTQLTLEVTESMLMGELVTSLDILTRLRLKGVCLSIDDFGTGYSSLSQLHRVPFTELKIDIEFVANMTKDDEARAIVKTCIMLGHELNMWLVAEGVEDRETWDLLTEMGCTVAQGNFIAKPMPGSAVLQWIANREQAG